MAMYRGEDVERPAATRRQTATYQAPATPAVTQPVTAPPRLPAPTYSQPQAQTYNPYGYASQQPTYKWQQTSEFTDPTTQNYESLLNYQGQNYMQPVYDPARNQYAGMLQNMTNALSPNDQSFQQYMSVLQSILGEAGGASPGEGMLMSLAGSLAGGGNIDQYMNEYRAKLAGDPYTGAEWESYRTAALDPIEQDRTAAQQQALNRISQQGIDPGSGIALALQNEVDSTFNQSRAAAQNQLGIKRVEDRNARDQTMFDIAQIAETLKMQGKSAAVGAASGANSAWYNRQGLRAGTASDLANALPQRLSAQIQPAATLSGLSANTRSEQDARYGQALQIAQALAQLPAQRQAEALAALGQGESPSNVLQSLNQISGMNYQNQQAQNLNNYNMQQGLGSMLGYLGQAWPQSSPGGGYTGTVNGGSGGTVMLPGNTWPGFGAPGDY
jgi:hypothetical protein